MKILLVIACVFVALFFLALFSNYDFGKWVSYKLWKKKAKKAIEENRVTKCYVCNNHIYPNQCVAIGVIKERGEEKEVLIHAGFHFSLENADAFCETGVLASGWWDGEKVISYKETMLDKLMSGECAAVIDNGDGKLAIIKDE